MSSRDCIRAEGKSRQSSVASNLDLVEASERQQVIRQAGMALGMEYRGLVAFPHDQPQRIAGDVHRLRGETGTLRLLFEREPNVAADVSAVLVVAAQVDDQTPIDEHPGVIVALEYQALASLIAKGEAQLAGETVVVIARSRPERSVRSWEVRDVENAASTYRQIRIIAAAAGTRAARRTPARWEVVPAVPKARRSAQVSASTFRRTVYIAAPATSLASTRSNASTEPARIQVLLTVQGERAAEECFRLAARALRLRGAMVSEARAAA